jgi:hypothetical protein
MHQLMDEKTPGKQVRCDDANDPAVKRMFGCLVKESLPEMRERLSCGGGGVIWSTKIISRLRIVPLPAVCHLPSASLSGDAHQSILLFREAVETLIFYIYSEYRDIQKPIQNL